MKPAKINSLNVYPVLISAIKSLMTPILPTFLSFSGYYVKGTNCWEHDFSRNIFSQNILWRFYPKTVNPIQPKFLIVKMFAKKTMVTKKI